MYLGLGLNVLLPMGVIVIGYFLKQSSFSGGSELNPDMLFTILVFVSMTDLGMVYYLKKRLLANTSMIQASELQGSTHISPEEKSRRAGLRLAIMIYALNLAPSIYGLVYFLITGNLNSFLLLLAFTPLGYLLLKPREEELKKLFPSNT
ncbi:MAG: hypothetical protein L0Y74_09020 [candidate division Zixibacteria bacterium]|nr:hypothetical protein [candidate division Zixibacteria bacterium]